MNSLWLIIVMLVLVYAQGLLYKRFVFSRLSVKRRINDIGAFPGDTVHFGLETVNNKLMPITWLRIEQKVPSIIQFDKTDIPEEINSMQYTHTAIISVLPFQKVNRTYEVQCMKRGYVELKDLTMTATNLFGTETYTAEAEIPVRLAIYPRIVPLDQSLVPASTTMGDFSVNRWIIDDPMMIIGIRDYHPTDSFKRINWKLSAKNQKLQVNKYDYTADKKIMIIFNLEKEEHNLCINDLDLMEDTIEAAASLALLLLKSGIPVGFATNALCLGEDASGTLSPDTGEKHTAAILKAFSQISSYKRFGSRELLKNLIKDFSWGIEVIVVTPSISSELITDLKELGSIKTTVISLEQNPAVIMPDNINLYYYDKGEAHHATL